MYAGFTIVCYLVQLVLGIQCGTSVPFFPFTSYLLLRWFIRREMGAAIVNSSNFDVSLQFSLNLTAFYQLIINRPRFYW
jgi:hypothetical protein